MDILCKCNHCKKYYEPNQFISMKINNDCKLRLVKECLKCRKVRNYSQNKMYRELRPTNDLHHKGFF